MFGKVSINYRLSTGTWDGYECAPKGDPNDPLSPPINIYGVEAHHPSSLEALDCFDLYSDCLQEGINNHCAVTTSCQSKSSCDDLDP